MFPETAWFNNPANRESWNLHLKTEYLEQVLRRVRESELLASAVNTAIDELEMGMLAEGLPDQIVRQFRRHYLSRRKESMFEALGLIEKAETRLQSRGTNREMPNFSTEKPAERDQPLRHTE